MSSKPQVFVPTDAKNGNSAFITGTDAHHLLDVLRLKIGSEITVCDMQRRFYNGVVTQIAKDSLCVSLDEGIQAQTEFPFEVTVYQCLPKGDKFETIVQKAVELGAARIVPVLSERAVSRPDAKAMAKKTERLNKIAQAAALQCGRGILPVVDSCISYKEALNDIKTAELGFVCFEGEDTEYISSLLAGQNPQSIAFLIGPEGGLSQSEAGLASEMGIALCGLGKRILRTETASGFVLAAIEVLTNNQKPE